MMFGSRGYKHFVPMGLKPVSRKLLSYSAQQQHVNAALPKPHNPLRYTGALQPLTQSSLSHNVEA